MRSRALSLLFLASASPALAGGLQIPQYETSTLENGLTVQLLRHDVVPLVSFELWIRAGASEDPAGKEGLSNLTAEALRKGAGSRDAQAFAEAIDFLGANFGTSVDRDRVRINLSLLAKDFDKGLELLADAVLRPTFDEAEMAKLASQLSDAVVEAKDNPRNVITAYHSAFLYGDHPYGKPVDGTEPSLAALTAADARAFHAERYGADRAVLTVAGDIDPKKAASKIRKAFQGMAKAKAPLATLPPPVRPAAPRVLLVNKNDTPQTWFMIGSLGPRFGEPDYAAAEVVRTVFGGRFTSWLNSRLRIETGLTYGARYNFSRGFVEGPASITTFTATETTKEAIDMALAVLDSLHQTGIGEEDLTSAKAYLMGQTPYDYETASDMGYAITELKFYGMDRARLDGLFDAISAVDTAACREVVKKYFARENLVTTAIGVRKDVEEILAAYGEIRNRENGDPGFR